MSRVNPPSFNGALLWERCSYTVTCHLTLPAVMLHWATKTLTANAEASKDTNLKAFWSLKNALTAVIGVLVETNLGLQKKLHLKAFQSLKNCLDKSTITPSIFILCLRPFNKVTRLFPRIVYFDLSLRAQNSENIEICKKWGFRLFQKEHQKARKTALFVLFLRNKCGFPHFMVLFLTLAETPFFCAL